MTVVVTENAYAEDTGWIVWIHIIRDIIIYSSKRHDSRAHRTQPSRRGSEKSERCPLKAPQKTGWNYLFFPYSYRSPRPRVYTPAIYYYIQGAPLRLCGTRHAGPGMMIIIIYEIQRSKPWDHRLFNNINTYIHKTNSLNMKPARLK